MGLLTLMAIAIAISIVGVTASALFAAKTKKYGSWRLTLESGLSIFYMGLIGVFSGIFALAMVVGLLAFSGIVDKQIFISESLRWTGIAAMVVSALIGSFFGGLTSIWDSIRESGEEPQFQ